MKIRNRVAGARILRILVVVLVLLARLGDVNAQERQVEAASRPSVRIALYDGAGAGRSKQVLLEVLQGNDHNYDIAKIDAEDVCELNLSEFDVLIFPGGSGGKQGRSLGDEGRSKVRRFVRQGGGYIGICAGAYLATNDYSWSLDLVDAKVVDRKHWARGMGKVKIQLSAEAKRLFKRVESSVEIFYGQGPLLARREWDDPAVPDYESLAIYHSEIAKNGAPSGIMSGTSAILRAEFGKGRVLLFSPHPEKTDAVVDFVFDAIQWVDN